MRMNVPELNVTVQSADPMVSANILTQMLAREEANNKELEAKLENALNELATTMSDLANARRPCKAHYKRWKRNAECSKGCYW